ncbi:MAG TPA: Holliday junction branch migration protein RuvA [Candidatus Coprosoma intestinipullorum]|uniref:Holliday junction branch migration complex subunit RuvA n=1 Tax=Candidatus Coprosoma intestinipullorum TaxID=2840752 RepID=A0A9D0ZRJ6_9FIRM|nr:Holliday junction branch migration protein RuvA [Candidatus Coprosoma intestinipullorum]
MYEYIKGKVTDIQSGYIVLENNGIGYLIYTANPYSFNIDEEYKLYVYQYIREDENTLYGFKSYEEKDLFLRLTSVKGLGCKMAIPMLASGSPEGIIDAIERENILYLKKFPKIGDKVARQIILDLKGKLVKKADEQVSASSELADALKSLGYKSADINKVVKQVDGSLDIEDQIKEALRLLLK